MNTVRIDLSYIFIFLFMYKLVKDRDPYLFSISHSSMSRTLCLLLFHLRNRG